MIRPQIANTQAHQQGIERPDVAQAIRATFDGVQTGVYRERDELLPIIARAPQSERGEDEDGAKAQSFLFASIPTFLGIMVLTVVMLFNAVKQPLIIWLTVPLSVIGVTVGLLIFKQPFGFMALLGMLSLSGMLIKNAIVLIDQIDLEIREGKERYLAVVDSGVSRLRPVSMAAAATILGMIPLLADAFFVSMAVTISVGLAFATVLTLFVVPVLYTVLFKIPSPKVAKQT